MEQVAQNLLIFAKVSLGAQRLLQSFSAVGLLQPGGGIATSALNVREFVLGAFWQAGVFEEETVGGDMLRQTEAVQNCALEVARYDCDNGKGMTIERFAQLCVQGGILASVYTHVRPCMTLLATADSRMHEGFKQGVGDFHNELLAYGERLAGGQGTQSNLGGRLCGGLAYHPAHGACGEAALGGGGQATAS